jgi:hypothetical protein
METTTVLAVVNWVLAVPPAIAAIYQMTNRKGRGSNRYAALPSILVLISALGCGFWLFSHPVKPTILTVEKTLPCPPSKTGEVKVGGKENIGNSGNDAHINDPHDTR